MKQRSDLIIIIITSIVFVIIGIIRYYYSRRIKRLSNLYTLLYNNIKDREYVWSLCIEIDKLFDKNLISIEEHNLLRRSFHNNKPNKDTHIVFYKNRNYTGNSYWWSTSQDRENESTEQRIKFIEYLINNHL